MVPLSNEALQWRVEQTERKQDRLEAEKASKEQFKDLKEDIQGLKTDFITHRVEVRDEVSGLRKTLLGVAGAWLFGTLMFLIAVLEFAQ